MSEPDAIKNEDIAAQEARNKRVWRYTINPLATCVGLVMAGAVLHHVGVDLQGLKAPWDLNASVSANMWASTLTELPAHLVGGALRLGSVVAFGGGAVNGVIGFITGAAVLANGAYDAYRTWQETHGEKSKKMPQRDEGEALERLEIGDGTAKKWSPRFEVIEDAGPQVLKL